MNVKKVIKNFDAEENHPLFESGRQRYEQRVFPCLRTFSFVCQVFLNYSDVGLPLSLINSFLRFAVSVIELQNEEFLYQEFPCFKERG